MKQLWLKTKTQSKIDVLEVEMHEVRSGECIFRC